MFGYNGAHSAFPLDVGNENIPVLKKIKKSVSHSHDINGLSMKAICAFLQHLKKASHRR